MKIGLDIMGGDFAPEAAVLGAIASCEVLLPNEHLVLIGDKNVALKILQDNNFDIGRFEYIHTTEVIGMAEHPTRAIAQKPDSSIATGFRMLKEGLLDSFASAGNTGAMLVGAMFSVKPIPGIMRPAIAGIVPKLKGGHGIILDVGANADCKPEALNQFGILGSLMAESLYHINNPKVGLINIGEEEEKGNLLSQAAFALMKEKKQFNFIGNVEGRDLFDDRADVFVCDGFTGNVILKLAENFYEVAKQKGIDDEFFDRFNYEQYGGSPVLGVNAPVVIGHGISNPQAIKSMIMLSRNTVESGLIEKIKQAFL